MALAQTVWHSASDSVTKDQPMKVTGIVVAAGRGTRAGGGVPKQYRQIAGRAVLDWTLRGLAPHVDALVVVRHPDDAQVYGAIDTTTLPCPVRDVCGADTRDGSVRAGLAAVPQGTTHVLIHDGARPCVPADLINRVIAALSTHAGAAPALTVSDALWTGAEGHVTGTQDRTGLFAAQTPQGFDLLAIRAAHAARTTPAADDVEVARGHGLDVAIVAGDARNIKITTPDDFARAEQFLRKESGMDIRLGNGYDVHRFGPGDHVVLCGVRVPHDRGLQGHSDADVGMHTVTDAIYGALAEGDIGRHFPPSEAKWKGADSAIFLRHAVDLAARRGYRIGNVDCTLVCEEPKIGPHADVMRARMAELMGLEMGRISVKATTSEQLGFTGRREGIACIATCTLIGGGA
jgi:2-C-methyl-D-erythritol 4-phosphate cytidylyltransferase/2-C-methyl-D-erythritol 2,4-cyclodiphosphate synthase